MPEEINFDVLLRIKSKRDGVKVEVPLLGTDLWPEIGETVEGWLYSYAAKYLEDQRKKIREKKRAASKSKPPAKTKSQ